MRVVMRTEIQKGSKWQAVAVVGLGWVLFGSSFFLDVIVTVRDLGSGKVLVFHVTLLGLLIAHEWLGVELRTGPFATIVACIAASTNIVMLASPWGVVKPLSRLASRLPLALLAAVLFNLGVFGIWQSNTLPSLGYYTWQASFLTVAVGLYLRRRQALRPPYEDA